MARHHMDFIETEDVEEELLLEGAWFGAVRRTLSEDDQSGASTVVLDCHLHWSADLTAETGLLEVLVLSGEIIASGQRLGRGGYVRAEEASLVHGIQAVAPSRLLVMADPSYEAPGGARPVKVLDTERLPYLAPTLGGRAGICVKMLNDDPERGPLSLIAANVGRYGTGPEFHSCPEEIYVLEGDVTGKYGTMTEGSYFWRPEFINHGPYWSEAGLIVFLRGFGDLYAYWHEDADATPEQNRANLPRFQAERAAAEAAAAAAARS
jgi:hypothetical protein